MDFATVLALGNHVNDVYDGGFNGLFGAADLCTPTEHIRKANRMVLDAHGGFSLEGCVTYAIIASMGFPEARAGNPIVVTAAHLVDAYPLIRARYAQEALFRLVRATQMVINLRVSDTISRAEAERIDGWAEALDAARKMAQFVTDNDVAKTEVLAESKMVTLALMANAIHRDQNEGHNWYTDRGEDKKTATGKTIAIAADSAVEFKAYMAIWGHDLWHVLTHACLKRFADAITGETEVLISRDIGYSGAVFLAGTTSLADLVKLPESATDRWPASQLGKGSALVGLDLTKSMLASLVSKVPIPEVAGLVAAVGSLRVALAEAKIGRTLLLQVRNVITPMIVIAYGFTYADPTKFAMANDSPSIAKVAKREGPDMQVGALIWKHWNEIEADRQAVGALLSGAVSSMSAAVAAAVAALNAGAAVAAAAGAGAPVPDNGFAAPAGPPPAYHAVVAVAPAIPLSAAQRAAADQARLMAMLAGQAAPRAALADQAPAQAAGVAQAPAPAPGFAPAAAPAPAAPAALAQGAAPAQAGAPLPGGGPGRAAAQAAAAVAVAPNAPPPPAIP